MVTQSPSPDWYSMSDPAIVAELCNTLKQLRLQQNLTQGQLAEKAGLSRSASGYHTRMRISFIAGWFSM